MCERRVITKGAAFGLMGALAICFFTSVSLAQEGQAFMSQGSDLIAYSGGSRQRARGTLAVVQPFNIKDTSQDHVLYKPSIDTGFSDESSISGIIGQPMTEEEKLYRYFGIATVFRKLGNTEEAIEILEYISHKSPDDKYVKEYLDDIRSEESEKEKRSRSDYKKDARALYQTRIKELTKEGIAYYKQKDYDKALLAFSDLMAIDPDNRTGQKHMDKLKEHYEKEMRLERIILDGFDRERAEDGGIIGVEEAAEGLLDMHEYSQALEEAQADVDMEQLVIYKKADSLLNNTEQDFRIEEIISQRKEVEEKKELFTLGPGDVIIISVRDHPELSGKTIVRPDGFIILPLINDNINAMGLTREEAQVKVEESLGRYVQDPSVYVGIEQFNSKTFYFITESGATPYTIPHPSFTLRDALFLSDWGNNRALGRVLIVKPDKLHPIVKKVDAFDIIYRGNLAKNVRIEDGDVIYVPTTAAAKITETIKDSVSPIKAVKDLRNEWLDMRWNRDDGWSQILNIPQNKVSEDRYQPTQMTNQGILNVEGIQ
ncbi:MAG: polysaccharide biosynthesis/export family protein [Candidatus Omnitrophota bacterium]